MGMDYTYAGSASYDRFDEELTKVADVFCGKRIKTEEGEPLKFTFPKDTNETLVNWFNNSFGEGFTYEDTLIVWKIISHNGDRATIKTMITQGDLQLMEELLDLFCDRQAIAKKFADLGYGLGYHKYGFKLVMDRLDRESQKPDAIFRKGYICYNGIINRPTRCFVVIEKLWNNPQEEI